MSEKIEDLIKKLQAGDKALTNLNNQGILDGYTGECLGLNCGLGPKVRPNSKPTPLHKCQSSPRLQGKIRTELNSNRAVSGPEICSESESNEWATPLSLASKAEVH